jgi:hypothetical protein
MMSLTPTKLYMNWVATTATPQVTGGAAVTIDGVTSVRFDRSSRQEVYYGDNRMFARIIKNVEKKRSVSIHCGNIGVLESLADDTQYTIVTTLADPKNGVATGGGAITFTLVNASIEKIEADDENNKYGKGTITLHASGAEDEDGNEVDPFSYALV